MRFSYCKSYVVNERSALQEWIIFDWAVSGNRDTMSFFWSINKNCKVRMEKYLKRLTIELDQKLASLTIPHTNGTILATSEDVILISVDCCHSSAMSL